MLSEVGGLDVGRLSDGQKECLRLVLAHKTSKEIARQLGISSHTVDQRLRYALRTLGARTRMQAALRLQEAEIGGNHSPFLIADPERRQTGAEPQHDIQQQRPLMHQSVDLPSYPDTAPQFGGRSGMGPDIVHRFSFSASDFIERPGGDTIAEQTSPQARLAPVEKPQSAGEFRRSIVPLGFALRWYQKLLLILVIAMMMIMSVGSLMVGIEALSDFLK